MLSSWQETGCKLGLVHRLIAVQHLQHDLTDNSFRHSGHVLFSQAGSCVRHTLQGSSQSHLSVSDAGVQHSAEIVGTQQFQAQSHGAAVPKHRLLTGPLARGDTPVALGLSSCATAHRNTVLSKESDLVLRTQKNQ